MDVDAQNLNYNINLEHSDFLWMDDYKFLLSTKIKLLRSNKYLFNRTEQ